MKIVTIILLMGLITLTYAGYLKVRGLAQESDSDGKKEEMEHSTDKKNIPPIDRDIPEELETATFALG